MTNPTTHNTQSTPIDSAQTCICGEGAQVTQPGCPVCDTAQEVLAHAFPTEPEIGAADFASPSALLSAFIAGEIKPPCWIRAGAARFKVTDGNIRDFTRGMLLAVEMEAAR